jgi:hypothetical protein
LAGSGTTSWSFDPFLSGVRRDSFTIQVDDPKASNLAVGRLEALGLATNPTDININLPAIAPNSHTLSPPCAPSSSPERTASPA